ncbi:MAG: DNA repair exonuclease [Dehalococcoidia bacterium]|nr:DNA repair exonuclease [Dehalococcoidia bacterium]
MIRILHTADVHIGREFPALRDKGPEYRRRLLATFERIIDLAILQDVQLLLIAGDLFDSNAVMGSPVRAVLASFEKLHKAGIRVCLLPGMNDPYTEDSIYRFMHLPANVTVLTPQEPSHTYADLDTTVYGRACQSELSGTSAFEGLRLRTSSRFHIGLAHCLLRSDGVNDKVTMFIDSREIAASRLDYLALGHWHTFRDCSEAATKAFYCGSPEPLDMNQKGTGSVALVTIHDKKRVDVQQIGIGSHLFDEMTVNLDLFGSVEEIARMISAEADPNLILQVTLQGTHRTGHAIEIQELEKELQEQFFCLRILDQSSGGPGDVATAGHPPGIIGAFTKAIEARMAKCPAKEKEIYAEASRLGVALLQKGTRVIT